MTRDEYRRRSLSGDIVGLRTYRSTPYWEAMAEAENFAWYACKGFGHPTVQKWGSTVRKLHDRRVERVKNIAAARYFLDLARKIRLEETRQNGNRILYSIIFAQEAPAQC